MAGTEHRCSANQAQRLCPFLSAATGETTPCIKSARGYDEPVGVCTISSDSNGKRQDWLACPYRTLDQHFTLLATAVRTTYKIPPSTQLRLLPTTILDRPDIQSQIFTALKSRRSKVFIFTASKLGGEVDIAETVASPGGKVDMSVIEITSIDKKTRLPNGFGQHMFYEIQTADFHGSPLHATKILKAHFPRGAQGFHKNFACEMCGTAMEGPNKANIFKRTIYQMVFKIQLASSPDCAGFLIILPEPVWESWLKHLGQPTLSNDPQERDLFYLLAPDEPVPSKIKSWIFVFDIDRESPESPQPISILARIATSSTALLHYAFTAAPTKALQSNVIQQYRRVFSQRVLKGWKGVIPPEDQPITPTPNP